MPFQLSIDLSVDPSFGFVKALRIVKECNPRNLVSDSERMTMHLDFEGEPEHVLSCIERIKGLASIDVRYLFGLCIENPRKVFKELGFSIVPPALSTRVIGYRAIGDGLVFIEKTSKKDLFIARYAKAKVLPLPVPPSIYVVYGYLPDVAKKARENTEVLREFMGFLESKLKSMGLELSPCREEASEAEKSG